MTSAEEGGRTPAEVSFFRQKGEERPEPVPGLERGKVVGDFRLVALIGQGGMGQVWEAEQLSLGKRIVAVKFVRPERVTEKQLELFAREARAGGRLSHPGIVGVHGYGTSDGLSWIALEFIAGACTLKDFLDEVARASEVPRGYDRHLARFVAEVAEAMQVAHEAGVIHRDLKPENVLVTSDDHPKVTDFGLARITDESALSRTGDFAGTYYYMSPEQVTAKRMGIDHRTDVFSLGVVLYELLALRRPFEGDTTHQVAERIVTEDPPDPRTIRSKVPRDLAVIAGKALEKSRDKRYQSMRELAADLRRYLADEPILARAPTRLDRTVKWVRRNPAKSWVAGVVLLALLAISALLLENVRANRDLERSNVALEVKTEESEARRLEAERAAAAEHARAEEVLRLSDLQNLEELVRQAEDLWPARPATIGRLEDWIRRAEALVAKLPEHRATLGELRAHALPRSAVERELERESHPEWAGLAAIERLVEARRRALAERRDGVRAPLPEVDWSRRPAQAIALNDLAWNMVDPKRKGFGEELLGLALALRANELAAENEKFLIGDTLAWALFALGRDEEALVASAAALAAAPADRRAEFEGYLRDLERAVEQISSNAALRQAEQELVELEARRAELDAEVDARRDWRFPTDAERWWNGQLERLIAEIEALRSGLLAPDAVIPGRGWSVPKRLALAVRLHDGFAPGRELARAWDEALAAIHRELPELELAPQMGLVPLGKDPASGVWEFADLQTGAPPVRAREGKLVLTEDSALVFVLVPGGTFVMGAQARDPAAPSFHPDASVDEGPVREVTLAPYFLAKHEMTQAQWRRWTGTEPSHNGPRNWSPSWNRGEPTPSLVHPVEKVSWSECERQCARLGFALPSEAQWELAARAGSVEPWWCGDDPGALAAAANVLDQHAKGIAQANLVHGDWDDGAAVHLPVDAQTPNPFGFHGMIGNVWEWCADGYYTDAYRSLPLFDPLAPPSPTQARARRGGGYGSPPSDARSANRGNDNQEAAVHECGLRPARALERP